MTHTSANTPHHTYYYRHTATHIRLQTHSNTNRTADITHIILQSLPVHHNTHYTAITASPPQHTLYCNHCQSTTSHIILQSLPVHHNTHYTAITASPPHHTLYCNDATSHITLPITLQHTYIQLCKTLQHTASSAKSNITTAHNQLCKTQYSTQPTLQNILHHTTNSAKHTTAHNQLCKTHYITQPTL